VATREFYRRVIEFARAKQIVVVQDAAHILLTFDGEPLSFLSIPGAREVGVEVHSLSKGFDMIGWRIGWVCGNERLVQAFADVKDNCDSGQFIAIQKAAVTALDDDSIPERVRSKYRRRMEKAGRRTVRLRLPLSACRAVRISCTRRHRAGVQGGPEFPAPRQPAST
jgi:LL-diaminopimelate aminotransferase